MDDPCHKVLPLALKKYDINAPWQQYALHIVYGDQERYVQLDEKPLTLFKQLDQEGRKPMFMNTEARAAPDSSSSPAGGQAGPPSVSIETTPLMRQSTPFSSAMPMHDMEAGVSLDRNEPSSPNSKHRVLYLAVSLFEFKHR